MGELLRRLAIRAVADEAQAGVDAAVQEPLEGEQDVVRALDGGHAADPADREALVGDAHHPPGPLPRLRRRVDALLELDAEADDRELLPRRDAERDEVVTHLRADGDERRRRGREAPLEHAEEAGADGAEVAAEDVAVERVDDDRRPRVAGEQRCRAADGAGLRRVRVEDVRAELGG